MVGTCPIARLDRGGRSLDGMLSSMPRVLFVHEPTLASKMESAMACNGISERACQNGAYKLQLSSFV